jgi:predicted short-subunit dehydrogenase-like oxidoreductase (DUF2520 family)
VRVWDEAERRARSQREAAEAQLPARDDPDALALLAAGAHRHGDVVHAEAHAHPHVGGTDDGRPVLGIIGAGAVGTALGVAFHRAGWRVAAASSRDAGRRDRFASLVPGARTFADARAIVDECHLVIVAVPDDAVAPLAEELRLYSGQAIVHTSGVLGADALTPALAAGTQAGSFHPLVAFADVERAVQALHGATIAVEAARPLEGLLVEMAGSIGGVPVALPPGSKPAYHAAAVLAAAGLVALLDAIAELGGVAGLDEAQSLAVYAPLLQGTLDNARSLGIAAALTGPMTRGDVGTLEAHAATLAAHAPSVTALYRELTLRAIAVAADRGSIDGVAAARLRAVVSAPAGWGDMAGDPRAGIE